MTLQTKLPGSAIQTGTISVTAITNFSGELSASLPPDVVSSSAQVKTFLPTDTVSSSAQVTAFLPTGTVSSSGQLPSGIASSSAQVIAYLPTDTVSSSAQVTAFLPTGTVSSSTQLPSGIASSSAQVIAYLPTGTVSSSTQVDVFTTIGGNTLATTGSNTFTAAQTISDTTNSTSYLDGALHIVGGMSVRKDVRVSGSMTVNGLLTAVSMSTQYVTASEYTIGTSKILLNDDDLVRFAGLSIVDSGSSSPTTASIYWDSLQHRFIYENLSGSAYNSSIIIAGPKHTGSLGDEPTLTSGYIPVATGTDHIDNSVIFQSGSNIGIGITTPNYKLNIKGDNNTTPLYVEVGADARYQFSGNSTSGYTTTVNMDNTGLSIGHNSNDRDFRLQTNSTPRITIAGPDGYVGIGTTNPGTKLQVQGSAYITGSLAVGTSDAGLISYFYTYQNSTLGATPNIWVVARGFLNDYAQIGFGYQVGTQPPVVIGSQVTSQSDNTKGNFIIATRDVTTDTAPTIRMLVDTAGKVGIGITNPSTALHVSGSSPQVTISGTASSGNRGISFVDGNAAKYNFFVGAQNNVNNAFEITPSTAAGGTTYSTPAVVINSSGNVGIGTTVTDAALEISKAITFTNLDTFPQLIIKASGGSTGRRLNLGVDDANNITFIQAINRGTDVMNLSLQRYGGNVGIGITDPSSLLHVYGRVSVRDGYNIGSPDGNTGIYFSSNTANIQTNGSNRFVIDSSGNVYTTTGSPISYGEGETYTIWSSEPEATAVSNDANWKSMKTFVCSKSGTLKFKFSAYISSGTYYWAWRILKNGATVVASGNYLSGLDTGETTSVHAYRRFVATVGPIAAGDSLVLQMISASGGGTPVTGNGQTLYAKEFRAYSTVPSVEHGGASNIWGDAVGIGRTNPSYKLDVLSTSADMMRLYYNDGTYNPRLTVFGSSEGIHMYQSYSTSANSLIFGIAGFEQMRIKGSNVGIGTTNPSRTLHLYGTDNTAVANNTFWNFNFVGQEITNASNTANTVAGLAFVGGSARAAVSAIAGIQESTTLEALAFFTGGSGRSSTVPERMRINSAGKVGIGTTNPGYGLDVAYGDARFYNTIIANVSKGFLENSSNVDFFRVEFNGGSGGAVQVIVELHSANGATGAGTTQIYHAAILGYYGGTLASGSEIQRINLGGSGGHAWINSVSLSGTYLTFRVSSDNNGTGTTSYVSAVVKMNYQGNAPGITTL